MACFHIFSEKEAFTEGIFGQILVWLLETIHHLDKNNTNLMLSFDINALAYDNIIPTFIQPNEIHEDFDNKINVKTYKISNGAVFDFEPASFETANKLWNKYFKFSKQVEDIVPQFTKSETLGVHYRGTDKIFDNSQTNHISQEEFIYIISDFLSKQEEIKAIYCCSDEGSFINNIRKNFNNIKVIEYQQPRSIDTSFAFFRNGYNINKQLKDNLTIGALVDMISLSRCEYVIKTSSALSAFSKIIQPDLKIYTVSAMKERWFPTAMIEPYKSDSEKVSSILKRTLYGNAV
jgi:hypothetical protein